MLSGLLAAVAGALFMRGWARRHFNEPLRFDSALAQHLLRIGWAAAVLEFVVTVYMRAAYFLLHDAGPQVVGQYAAADRLMRPILAVAGAVFASSLPTVAQQAARHEFRDMLRVYRRAVLRVSVALMPIGAGAWYFASWLLTRFAKEYVAAIWPFRILMVGTFFMFLNQLSGTYIVALGKFRVIMSVAIINLLVYLVLGTRLIPRFGASGAAMATSAMEALNTVMQLIIVFWLLRRSTRQVHQKGHQL
jgi:O-antigen/teichoic acid export membrane protein